MRDIRAMLRKVLFEKTSTRTNNHNLFVEIISIKKTTLKRNKFIQVVLFRVNI